MKHLFTFLILLTISVTASGQLPNCESPEFYVVGNAGDNWGNIIVRFKLESPMGPVSYNGSTSSIVQIGSEGPYVWSSDDFPSPMSLAIANYGEGAQFYASTMNFWTEIFEISKYDGDNWEEVFSDFFCHQMGGKNEHIYFQTHPVMDYIENDQIYHYDGEQAVLIWESQGESDRLTAADIAVDDNGNAYFFTGNIPGNPGVADTLNIISPEGEIISQFPVDISTLGSSSAFFMYDILYLYYGPYMYLVPVHISSSGVVVGSQIPVPKIYLGSSSGPNGTFDQFLIAIDGDSCFSGTLSDQDFFSVKTSTVYPNPVKDYLFFESKETVEEIEIFNLAGQMLASEEPKNTKGKVNVQLLPAGTYIIRIISEGKVKETHKFIKL